MDVTTIMMLVVMIGIFYFMLIRPENKRKKETEQMRSELNVGETVTTIGGIKGKIVHVKDEAITIETSEDRVRIEIAKWGVSTTGKMEAAQAAKQQGKKK